MHAKLCSETADVSVTNKLRDLFLYDLVAHVKAPTLEELARIISDKMRGAAGVLSTESLIIGF